MRGILESSGTACDAWRLGTELSGAVQERANCTSWLVLSTYASSTDAQAEISQTVALLNAVGIGWGFVLGENWLANCTDAERCQRVKDALGGELVLP